MGDNWLVDRFDVKSATPHTYDWIWHVRGEEVLPEEAVEATLEGEDTAYKYLEDVRGFEVGKPWEMTWSIGQEENKSNFYGSFIAQKPEQVFLATVPDRCGNGTRRALIRRQQATDTTFIAVFSDSPKAIRRVPRAVRKRLLGAPL